MFSVAFLTLAATVAAQYDAPAAPAAEKAVNDLKVNNLAEAYITGKSKDGDNAAIYYSTAEVGKAAWSDPAVLYKGNDLVDPRGVALCGPKVDGQSQWLYVADAGNQENGGYVYRYKIQRDAENVGELDVEEPEIVYGDGKGDYRPTDVACDEAGNVWWNDEAQNEIRWAKAEDLDKGVVNVNNKFVGSDCEKAVDNVQGLEVAGNWVYWSNNDQQVDKWAPQEEVEELEARDEDQIAEDEEVAAANNGVWRVAIENSLDQAECLQCKGAEEAGEYPSACGKGDEIEFFSQKEDGGYVALAERNDNIYAVDGAGKGAVVSLGKNDPDAEEVAANDYSAAPSNAIAGSYVADAGDRGLIVLDEISGKGYVVADAGNHAPNLAFELPADQYAYGVAYGEGVEADDVEDSAVSMVVSAFAGLVAVAALF